MNKIGLSLNLSVIFLREGDSFVAYAPALDLSTSASSFEKAKKRFGVAAKLFFEEIIKKGTFEEVLGELGWKKHNQKWESPMVISQEIESISIPVMV